MPDPTSPAHLLLGEAAFTALVDAQGSFTAFRDAFPDATEAQEADARSSFPELFDGDRWTLPFRAFLVRVPSTTILVDTGLGPPSENDLLPQAQGLLPRSLASANVSPDEIDLVFLTHLHVDHVGWNLVRDARPLFPRARFVTSAEDWRYFHTPERIDTPSVAGKVTPLGSLGRVDLLPSATVELAPGVVAFPTPGHTPGHMSVRVSSRGETAVILGDVAVHPLQIAAPSVAYVHEVDAKTAARTRGSVLRPLADAGTVVAQSHFPGSGLGCIVRSDGSLRFSSFALDPGRGRPVTGGRAE